MAEHRGGFLAVGGLKVRFTPESARTVSKLHPEIKKMIRSAIDGICHNPHLGRDLEEDLSGFKSYRIKRYRIVYKFSEDQGFIDIYHVGHRRDVYEHFRELLGKLT